MQYTYSKKEKKIKEMNELKREKWDVEKKSGVMKMSIIQRLVDRERRKLDTYSCKCINFGRSKTQAFFKNMEKFILSLDQIVRWVMGRLNFLLEIIIFVSWLNSRGVSYQGQWSVVPLYDRDGLPCSRKAKSFADVVLEVERA